MRSRRKRPRNSSLAKLGFRQSCSRAASATCRASRSVTTGFLRDGADMRLTSPRIGISDHIGYRWVLPDRWYPIPGEPTTPRASDRPSATVYDVVVGTADSLEGLGAGPGSGDVRVVRAAVGELAPDECRGVL